MKLIFFIIGLLLMLAFSCSKTETVDTAVEAETSLHDEMNSVYYWKTVFHLDSSDLSFIKRHDIGRVYLRMFDVTEDNFASDVNMRTVPNASVKVSEADYQFIRDSLVNIDFVPVVYITLDAIKAMKNHEEVLASNVVDRVRNMCGYNGMSNVGEIQLDCDWTPSTEDSFFTLCDSVKATISRLGLSWRLSSTIRLHQLARKAPPVDNGVLMVYNTGSFNNPDAVNSIIDLADVEPYLHRLSSYPLHLDVAYPTYSWQLVFRNRQFVGLANGLNLSDTAQFYRKSPNSYEAKKIIPYNDRLIRPGDIVRFESSPADDVIRIKDKIEKRLNGSAHSNILYHLDSANLSKYSPDEINNIFSTCF